MQRRDLDPPRAIDDGFDHDRTLLQPGAGHGRIARLGRVDERRLHGDLVEREPSSPCPQTAAGLAVGGATGDAHPAAGASADLRRGGAPAAREPGGGDGGAGFAAAAGLRLAAIFGWESA
jgi:hypothetical protein